MRCVGGLPRSFARCALLARVLGGGPRALAALAGVVGAVRRLHCDARPQGAPRNSLRSLRSLRSDNRGESEMEARYARRPDACASRHPGNRRQRPQPAAQYKPARWLRRKDQELQVRRSSQPACAPFGVLVRAHARLQRGAVGARGWPRWRRAAQVVRLRAQRASISFSAQLSERSERSERSEFCAGPRERAAQGSRHAVPTATVAGTVRSQPPFAEQHNGQRPTPASHCHGHRIAPSIDARCSE